MDHHHHGISDTPANDDDKNDTSSSLIPPSSPQRISRSSLRLSQSWSTRQLLAITVSNSSSIDAIDANDGGDITDDKTPPPPPPPPSTSKEILNSVSSKTSLSTTDITKENNNNNNGVASTNNNIDDSDEYIDLAYFPLLDIKEDDDNNNSIDKPVTDNNDNDMKKPATVSRASSLSQRQLLLTHPQFNASDIWDDVPMGPSDAILGIAENYKKCTHPNKVNVAIGAYRDEYGQPWILPSVHEAEQMIWENKLSNKEYLPIEGDHEYLLCAMKFAYGPDIDMNHIAVVQTLSGTGACRIGGCFLAQYWPKHPIYVPNPTWGNHISIFHDAGLIVKQYRYYHKQTNTLDIIGMIADIQDAPNRSIILLHACAHNPTGCDPTIEQWKEIINIIQQKEHIAFFDSAYQGFASGNAEQDAQPFRFAVSQKVPILLAQSFAKNFGLYGERVGTLSIVCGDLEQKEHIESELRCIIRPMYSSPPKHGSTIIKTILMNDKLTEQYHIECLSMSERIQQMRILLVKELHNVGSIHDWDHITSQIGMFAFTGLNEQMCIRLTNEYVIFLTTNGRISITGLNPSNITYVANALHQVTVNQTF